MPLCLDTAAESDASSLNHRPPFGAWHPPAVAVVIPRLVPSTRQVLGVCRGKANGRPDKVRPKSSSLGVELWPGLGFTSGRRRPSLSRFSTYPVIVRCHRAALWGHAAHCRWGALGERGSRAQEHSGDGSAVRSAGGMGDKDQNVRTDGPWDRGRLV